MQPRDQILMVCRCDRFLLLIVVFAADTFGFGIIRYALNRFPRFGKITGVQQNGHVQDLITFRNSFRKRPCLVIVAQDLRTSGNKPVSLAETDLSGAWSEDGTRSKRWFEETELERQSKVVSVRVSHILVTAEEMADSLMEQIRSGSDFNALAAAISACEHTRADGGAVGWVGRTDEHLDAVLPAAARSAALQQKPGDVVQVKSPRGVHLVKVPCLYHKAATLRRRLRERLGFALSSKRAPSVFQNSRPPYGDARGCRPPAFPSPPSRAISHESKPAAAGRGAAKQRPAPPRARPRRWRTSCTTSAAPRGRVPSPSAPTAPTTSGPSASCWTSRRRRARA